MSENNKNFAMVSPNVANTPSSWLAVAGLDLGDRRCALQVAASPGGIGSGIYLLAPQATAGAYAANQCIGTLLQVTAFTKAGGTAMITDINVVDAAAQAAALRIFFFRGDPGWTCTNKTAITFGGTSIGNINRVCAVYDVAASDYVTIVGADNTVSFANIGASQRIDNVEAAQILWALVVSNGTPNYGGDKLRIKVGLTQ